MNKEIKNNENVGLDYYDKNVIRNINYEMVELYYEIGATINELIENYNLEVSQNEIIKSFSLKLTKEFVCI